MNAAGNMVLLFVLGALAATTADAQEIAAPDRARLQAMSPEELSAYREQLQRRIEGLGEAEQRLMRETSVNGRNQLAQPGSGGGYGQGYGSRGGQGGNYGGGGGRGGHRR